MLEIVTKTLSNVAYMLYNRILTVLQLVGKDFEYIPKGPKSTDFDQNPWDIAHGFEQDGFW